MNVSTAEYSSAALNSSASASFLLDEALYSLCIEDGCLIMKCVQKAESNSLPLSDLSKSIKILNVIATTYEADHWVVNRENKPLLEKGLCSAFTSNIVPCFLLTIHYHTKSLNYCRKMKTFKLRTQNEKDCLNWTNLIKLELGKCLQEEGIVRPRNLLVILNPFAGRKNAKAVHTKVISHLFKKAEITETVIVTQRKGHATELLEATDLSLYDGIIAVGGDGTFNEVVNGVLINEQRKKGIDLNSKDSDLEKPIAFSKPSVRLALIPIGSGNIVAFSSQGTADVETATLHVICGETHPLDISCAHDGKGKFLKFSVIFEMRGFYSQMVKKSERWRMLGSFRYMLATFLSLAKLTYFSGEIRYLPSSSDNPEDMQKDASRCTYPCNVCLTNASSDKKQNGEFLPANRSPDVYSEDTWKIIRGSFSAITLTNTSFRNPKTKEGVYPWAHLADGTKLLSIIYEVPKMDFLNQMSEGHLPETCFKYSFIEVHKVKAFQFRTSMETKNKTEGNRNKVHTESPPSPNSRCWSIDGESTNEFDIQTWVHQGLINIFSKGIED